MAGAAYMDPRGGDGEAGMDGAGRAVVWVIVFCLSPKRKPGLHECDYIMLMDQTSAMRQL